VGVEEDSSSEAPRFGGIDGWSIGSSIKDAPPIGNIKRVTINKR